MALDLPPPNDPLSNPDHSIKHRVVANDQSAPEKSITIESDGKKRLGDGVTNYTQIDEVGDLLLVGSATVWEDLRFPATRIRQGATTKPDFDITNLGLLFPQNDATEIAYLIAQIAHSYKLESSIYPHIHYVQDEAEEPVFKIDYRWYKNGADPTGGFTTITASNFIINYVSGSIMQIVSFPAISGSGIDTVSSILDIKLYRDDNVVSGDVLVKEFDIHYEINTLGSKIELAK